MLSLEVVHAKVVPSHVEEFRDAGFSVEFAKAVGARYKAAGTGLSDIPSLAEQRAFVRNLGIERTIDVPEGMDGKKEN